MGLLYSRIILVYFAYSRIKTYKVHNTRIDIYRLFNNTFGLKDQDIRKMTLIIQYVNGKSAIMDHAAEPNYSIH